VSRRALTFMVFAIAVSAGCVRLGFWQLHRLSERRALNAMLAARLTGTPASVSELARDSATAAFRRATTSGTYDFSNELVLAARTRQGSPGVNIVTPLRPAGSDTAILVNRGWVYAPDAMTVDLSRWHERPAATVTGYLLAVDGSGRGPVSAAMHGRVVRRLVRDSLAHRLPYPIAPFLIVATDSVVTAGDSTPARLGEPVLDDGPHLGYALQWFAFALIGIVGAVVVGRADKRGTWLQRPTTVAPRVRQ